MRTMLRSKIHRATVTEAELDYEGSITVDADLLDAAGIVPFEWVHVWNVTTGARIETCALHGVPGSGTVCVNGARYFAPGDIVIVATTTTLDEAAARSHVPVVVLVDAQNRIREPERAVPRS